MVMKVTPWEVSGDIDYDKLLKEFGIRPLENLPKRFSEFLLFRRGIIFAHRDFGKIAEAAESGAPFAMMTGLMPSGKFHFGHKLVADQMVFYQKMGAKIFVTVADIEAYNSRNPDMEELGKTAIQEYLVNYIALGLELKKCDFYFQSRRSKDGRKANAYYSLASLFARHATFNEFRAVYGEISPGKMVSSLTQAADMYHPQLEEFEGPLPVIVPVGIDQDPHIRLARDMAQRSGFFRHQISSTYHKFLPGLKGGKMSSSDESSYIALTDAPEEAANKIRKYAFSGGQDSVEEHRKKGGNPNVDVSFQMLKYGLETEDRKLKKIQEDYISGTLLSGELKSITEEKVKFFLREHQKKRARAEKAAANLFRV